MENTQQPLSPYIPVVADLAGVVLHVFLLTTLVERFTNTPENEGELLGAVVFGVIYILFLVGIVILQRFRPINELHTKSPFAIPIAILFSLFIVYAITDLSGFFTVVYDVDFGDVGNGYYFLITPAIYIFLSLLYPFFLRNPLEERQPKAISVLSSLLLQNLFLGATAAYLIVFFADEGLEFGRFMVGLFAYLALALFFLWPRVIYYLKTRQLGSLISFDLALLFYAISVAFGGIVQ